jgi:uncharacterized protein
MGMKDWRLAVLFKNLPDKYPHLLVTHHLRVLNRLMHCWGNPQFDVEIQDLLMNERSRQGFRAEVVQELMYLSKLHDSFVRAGLALPLPPDIWKHLKVAIPTAQGFRRAVEQDDLVEAKHYISGGIPVDFHFDGGQTPLMVATSAGNVAMVSYLLHEGANPNARDEHAYTALHWAAFYGHRSVAVSLIKNGADVNVMQRNKGTPLGMAVLRGHLELVELLLICKANPNLAGDSGTPLSFAVARDSLPLKAMLLEYGASHLG